MAIFGFVLLAVGAVGLLRFGVALIFSAAGAASFRLIPDARKNENSSKYQDRNQAFLKAMAVKTAIAGVVLVAGWILVQNV